MIVVPEEEKTEGGTEGQWSSGLQKTFSQDCSFENSIYSVGDFVYVQPSEANLQPHIVRIEKLWKDEAGEQAFSFRLIFFQAKSYLTKLGLINSLFPKALAITDNN